MAETMPLATRDGGMRLVDGAVLEPLMRRLGDRLIGPSDPRYEQARRVWNGTVDRHPGLIARCASVDDVQAAVDLAREQGLRLSVRGGGHNVAGHGVCEGGLVIDLSGMRAVHVAPRTRSVVAQGGARLGDVDVAAQAHGLAVPLGVVSATGAIGLTLGGGIGWLTRRFGLSCDNVRAVELVTADGALLRVSANEHADLFWALRGGGGNFGVVTSMEYQAHPVGPTVWRLMTILPAEAGIDAMARFREYAPHAHEGLTVLGIFWSAPEDPAIPASLHGSPVFIFLGCFSGPEGDAEDVLRPLRDVARPIADLSGPTSWLEMQSSLDADYPDGRNYHWKSLHLREMPDAFIREEATLSAQRPSPLTSLETWSLGGAYGRVDTLESAFGNRDARFLFAIESNWDDAARSADNIDFTRRVFKTLRPYSVGSYVNFPGLADDADDVAKAAYGPNLSRLSEIKARYDPDNLFRGNVNIPPLRAPVLAGPGHPR